MQKILVSLNIAVLVVLSAMFIHSCKNDKPTTPKEVPGAVVDKTVKIAYVDLDTIESKYEYFLVKKDELEKKAEALSNTMENKQRAFQNYYQESDRKAETMTQSEIQATQMKLQQMQQELEVLQESYKNQIEEDQSKFVTEYQTRIEKYLKQFNADKKYTFILSYRSASGALLYKDDAYDITPLVLDGLNKAYKESSTAPSK